MRSYLAADRFQRNYGFLCRMEYSIYIGENPGSASYWGRGVAYGPPHAIHQTSLILFVAFQDPGVVTLGQSRQINLFLIAQLHAQI